MLDALFLCEVYIKMYENVVCSPWISLPRLSLMRGTARFTTFRTIRLHQLVIVSEEADANNLRRSCRIIQNLYYA